jgi:hypothetical protein
MLKKRQKQIARKQVEYDDKEAQAQAEAEDLQRIENDNNNSAEKSTSKSKGRKRNKALSDQVTPVQNSNSISQSCGDGGTNSIEVTNSMQNSNSISKNRKRNRLSLEFTPLQHLSSSSEKPASKITSDPIFSEDYSAFEIQLIYDKKKNIHVLDKHLNVLDLTMNRVKMPLLFEGRGHKLTLKRKEHARFVLIIDEVTYLLDVQLYSIHFYMNILISKDGLGVTSLYDTALTHLSQASRWGGKSIITAEFAEAIRYDHGWRQYLNRQGEQFKTRFREKHLFSDFMFNMVEILYPKTSKNFSAVYQGRPVSMNIFACSLLPYTFSIIYYLIRL